jgi:DNA-binding NtrC family response regulator
VFSAVKIANGSVEARVLRARADGHGIIGRRAAMQALFAEVERFAPVDVAHSDTG